MNNLIKIRVKKLSKLMKYEKFKWLRKKSAVLILYFHRNPWYHGRHVLLEITENNTKI